MFYLFYKPLAIAGQAVVVATVGMQTAIVWMYTAAGGVGTRLDERSKGYFKRNEDESKNPGFDQITKDIDSILDSSTGVL